MKRLIVNADDFGMSLEVSRGIIEAASSGLVRATSAMPSSPAFDESMDLLESSSVSLDVGLHATLTWGRPLLDPREVPTLVDEMGNFLPRTTLFSRAVLGGLSVDEAYRELKAQAERMLSRRPSISHLDGHHHVHAFPTVSLAAERVAQKFGIRFVRSPTEGRWSPPFRAAVQRIAAALLPAASPGFWRRRGFVAADHFAGFALGAGDELKGRWLETLKRLREGTTEIMVHPGYGAPSGDGYAGRAEEIAVLSDPELIDFAERNGIEPTDFRSPPG